MTNLIIQNGEIRHVTRNPKVIIKVIGPHSAESLDGNGKVTKLDIYIQTNEFPTYHYIVIIGLVDSYTAPGNKFFIARLITNSSDYGNLEITEELYYKASTNINLKNSYITRDKFLIPESEVLTKKMYGMFDLIKLEESLVY